MDSEKLLHFLRARLSEEELTLPSAEHSAPSEDDYDLVIQRVARRVRQLESEAQRNQERIEARYSDLVDQPPGRQQTLLANSPAQTLLALVQNLLQQSWEERFRNSTRSLDLAALAVEGLRSVEQTGFLSAESLADLRAEVLARFGNACRINSDFRAAESALQEALEALGQGTQDRELKAEVLGLVANLRHDQGRADEAVRLLDRVVRLRRLLGDPHRLGVALIDRGSVACYADETVAQVCASLREGTELVQDEIMLLLALHNLGEFLARQGQGLEAWKVLSTADLLLLKVGTEKLQVRHQWIRGVTYRALGEVAAAAGELTEVREALRREGLGYPRAVLALDLISVRAAQGRREEIPALAQEALTLFRDEGLDQGAMSAVLILHRAAQEERVTAALAASAADFLLRYQHNKNLRFEPPRE